MMSSYKLFDYMFLNTFSITEKSPERYTLGKKWPIYTNLYKYVHFLNNFVAEQDFRIVYRPK